MRELLASMEDEVVSVEVSGPSLQRGMSEGQGDLVSGKSEQNPQSLRDSSFTKELIGYLPVVITENTIDLTVSSTHTLDNAI
jgi:hypothetical protein